MFCPGVWVCDRVQRGLVRVRPPKSPVPAPRVSPAVPGARGETEAMAAGERGGVRAAAAREVPRPARSRVLGGAAPSPEAGPRLRFPGTFLFQMGPCQEGRKGLRFWACDLAQLEHLKVPIWL